MKQPYKTLYACFIGYIVQAVVNSFVPLLFVTFQKDYGIPLSQITLLVTINFGLQLLVDFLSVGFIDRIGYRASAILAHVFAASGFLLLVILPEIMDNSFAGILISVMVYAIGGGLLEVLISPIVEACPTEHKEQTMSMLHSFYCWGCVGVVLISTLFFAAFGTANWKILTLMWMLVPIANGIFFTQVPIAPLIEEGEEGMSIKDLFREKIFWVLMLLMVCAGASEQAVSQWASTFAEQALGVSKTVGDLTGPLSFSVFMGLSRFLYGKYGAQIKLHTAMVGSGLLCIFSYLLLALVPHPAVGLIGCGICGFSVGILWPGTFSMAAASLKNGGTALFALLALAGDLGCSGGPTVVGEVSSLFGDDFHKGILAGVLFPVLLMVGIHCNRRLRQIKACKPSSAPPQD